MRASMMGAGFTELKRVLCLGAHSDDLEIGCGGTMRRIIQASPGVAIRWHVLAAAGERRREALRSARALLAGAKTSMHWSAYPESYFPQHWAAIKDEFEAIKRAFDPDVVFTHWRDDRHQDHRVLSDLAWNTFRNHLILEYEVPKYDGDLGNPNVYVALDEATCREKVSGIVRHFRTQAGKHWFTEDAFLALLRLRGIECGARARYAEAFYARKLVI